MKVRFDLETKTKNYVRYNREAENSDPAVLGKIYVLKSALEEEFGETPGQITVEITAG